MLLLLVAEKGFDIAFCFTKCRFAPCYLLFVGRTRRITQCLTPAFVAFGGVGKIAVIYSCNVSYSGVGLIATNPVQRAKGHEVQTSSRAPFLPNGKKEDSFFNESLCKDSFVNTMKP